MPWGTSTALVSSLSIAIAEVVQPLHRAVFSRGAVERVENDVGLEIVEPRRDLTVHVELGDPFETAFAKRLRDPLAAHQRHRALGRPSAHQHDDVEQLIHARPSSRRKPGPRAEKAQSPATRLT
jgi:hypothetical protein